MLVNIVLVIRIKSRSNDIKISIYPMSNNSNLSPILDPDDTSHTYQSEFCWTTTKKKKKRYKDKYDPSSTEITTRDTRQFYPITR